MTTRIFLTLALLGLSASLTDGELQAKQSAAKQTAVGDVKIDWQGGFTWTLGTKAHFFGGVHAASETYDLQADDITFTFAPDDGALAGATAIGTASRQITGQFNQSTQGRQTFVYADRAVYSPDLSRPAGGRIDFTGHVTMRVIDPKNLVGPGLLAVETATIYLGRNLPGKAPEYPRLEGGAGKGKLTPKPDNATPNKVAPK